MRNLLRAINVVLFVAALCAAAFAVWSFLQVNTFSGEEWDARADEILLEADSVRSDIADAEAELQAKENELLNDLEALGEEGDSLSTRLEELNAEKEEKAAAAEELRTDVESADEIETKMLEMRHEYASAIRRLEDKINAGESSVRICYWTFDDGPTYLTQQFLDFCDKEEIHVTFFTSREANSSAQGDDPAVEAELLRQEILRGHSVGNHSNSHQYAIYGNLYQTIDGFKEQVKIQEDWIFECTKVKPDLFRFPGGSAHAFMRLGKEPLEAALEELGYVWID